MPKRHDDGGSRPPTAKRPAWQTGGPSRVQQPLSGEGPDWFGDLLRERLLYVPADDEGPAVPAGGRRRHSARRWADGAPWPVRAEPDELPEHRSELEDPPDQQRR